MGVRADRQWVRESDSVDDDGDTKLYATLPPSDLKRAADLLPFRPYVYRSSSVRESLRPLTEDGVLKPEFRPKPHEPKPRPVPAPKPKPVPPERDPDTFVPPPGLHAPVDEHSPCLDRKCDDPLYCVGHPLSCARCTARPRAQASVWCEECQAELTPTEEQLDDDAKRREVKRTKRERRLERENEELRRRLEALERATPAPPEPVPLYVRPFVCSSCDASSPMFSVTHADCSAGDCACYQAHPETHDRNRRVS